MIGELLKIWSKIREDGTLRTGRSPKATMLPSHGIGDGMCGGAYERRQKVSE
jgi:hypothetical protein